MKKKAGRPPLPAVGLGIPFRAARRAKGMTLRELSEATGIGISKISLFERGANLHVSTLYKLCAPLGITITLDYPPPRETCGFCDGLGDTLTQYSRFRPIKCGRCNGTGFADGQVAA